MWKVIAQFSAPKYVLVIIVKKYCPDANKFDRSNPFIMLTN